MKEAFERQEDIAELRQAVENIRREVAKVIVGQDKMVMLLVAALLSDGHVLIEGVPGVAKTLTAKLLARTLSTGFSRIQFTPDLMPSDVLGTNIYNQKRNEFEFRPGPVFSNIILIDEINRAPAKTQAALFEVMEERQITIDGNTNLMKPPFIVVATQNPIEQEGTYRLPEAQLDRFLFKIIVDYPSYEEEVRILQGVPTVKKEEVYARVQPVLDGNKIGAYQALVRQVRVEEKLIRYIASIVHNTRDHKSLYLGASPRASLAILNGSKAFAAIRGRDFVTPDDIRVVTVPVLAHRIILTPEKEMEGQNPAGVVQEIIQNLEVPR